MVQKRKSKKSITLIDIYEIHIEDWEFYFHFGVNPPARSYVKDAYWEYSRLTLFGSILSPPLKTANKARIDIADDLQMDDHWQSEPTIISAKTIGYMEIPRGSNELIFCCSVPSRALPSIGMAVQSGKIKFATIWGTVLKWRRGTVSTLSLSTHREEF